MPCRFCGTHFFGILTCSVVLIQSDLWNKEEEKWKSQETKAIWVSVVKGSHDIMKSKSIIHLQIKHKDLEINSQGMWSWDYVTIWSWFWLIDTAGYRLIRTRINQNHRNRVKFTHRSQLTTLHKYLKIRLNRSIITWYCLFWLCRTDLYLRPTTHRAWRGIGPLCVYAEKSIHERQVPILIIFWPDVWGWCRYLYINAGADANVDALKLHLEPSWRWASAFAFVWMWKNAVCMGVSTLTPTKRCDELKKKSFGRSFLTSTLTAYLAPYATLVP